MRRIHLDFVSPCRPVGVPGWLVLMLGICMAATVVGWDHGYWRPLVAADADTLRSLQAGIAARRTAVAKMDDPQLAAEWQRAIAVADELNVPWAGLFATFEAEAERPVAILSLESDAGKRDLILNGEARNLDAMLAYYRLLQQQQIFSGLTLNTHQINRQDPQRPIRFRVTAKWAARS